MTKETEHYIRFIREKLPCASERELELIFGLVIGLKIVGFSDSKYQRDI